MLNEGTSIQASICVSVRLMEGEHERPILSYYGLKTLFCVTDMIVKSLSCLPKHVSHLKMKTWNVFLLWSREMDDRQINASAIWCVVEGVENGGLAALKPFPEYLPSELSSASYFIVKVER